MEPKEREHCADPQDEEEEYEEGTVGNILTVHRNGRVVMDIDLRYPDVLQVDVASERLTSNALVYNAVLLVQAIANAQQMRRLMREGRCTRLEGGIPCPEHGGDPMVWCAGCFADRTHRRVKFERLCE